MIAVVIPYYRGAEFLDKCLSSLEAQTAEVYVFIVDNDRDRLQLPATDMQCTVLKARPEIGFGRAVNIGVFEAIARGARYLIIANQDTVFAPGAITALIAELSDEEPMTVCIPILMEYDMSAVSVHFARRTLARTAYLSDVARQETKRTYEVQQASGACLAIHSSVVESIGLFDPDYFMYGEDDDFFRRLHQAGGKIMVASAALVGHWHSLAHATGEERKSIDKYTMQARLALDVSLWRTDPLAALRGFTHGMNRLCQEAGWRTATIGTLPNLLKVAAHARPGRKGMLNLKRRIARQVKRDTIDD